MVTVAAPGDYGKPRSAVIVQADVMTKSTSVVLCPLTTHMVEAAPIRIMLIPDERNGLNQTSQIMADKVITVTRSRIGKVIGKLDDDTMLQLNRALAFVLGLGQ